MGNCLVFFQEKPFDVMNTDQNIIFGYNSPMKVPIFSHREISDKSEPQPAKKAKIVGFSDDDDVAEERRRAAGVVRIKFLIRKQELQAMLGEDGNSDESLSYKIQTKLNTNKIERNHRNYGSKGWLPALESIPEVN